jgi:dihydrolipoamide dehydrogenase
VGEERAVRIVVLGGGPGGYEAALVAAQLGASVTVVERDGLGGSAVLTDVVPSKTLIATAEVMTLASGAGELGVRAPGPGGAGGSGLAVDLGVVNARVKALARAQSEDIGRRLESEGVRLVAGRGRLDGPREAVAELDGGGEARFEADTVLVAVGAHPRVLPDAAPDGDRVLTWTQLYDLDALPERLVVVGSGVTGAEFASGYDALGAEVVWSPAAIGCCPAGRRRGVGARGVFSRRGVTVLSAPGPGGGEAGRRRRRRHAHRRDHRGGLAHYLGRGRLSCRTPGHRPGGVGVRLGPGGHVGPTLLRTSRARASTRRETAPACSPLASVAAMRGPDRDVARAGRRGDTAGSPAGLLDRVHRAGDRHRGCHPAGGGLGGRDGLGADSPAGDERAGQDARIHDGFIKLIAAPGPAWCSAGWWWRRR